MTRRRSRSRRRASPWWRLRRRSPPARGRLPSRRPSRRRGRPSPRPRRPSPAAARNPQDPFPSATPQPVVDVTSRVFPAVVRLDVAQEIYAEGKRTLQRGIGSGVIIDDEGRILTNFHVAGRARGNLRHALQQGARPRQADRRRPLDRPGRRADGHGRGPQEEDRVQARRAGREQDPDPRAGRDGHRHAVRPGPHDDARRRLQHRAHVLPRADDDRRVRDRRCSPTGSRWTRRSTPATAAGRWWT